VWTAVNHEHERVFAALVEVGGQGEPAMNATAFRAREPHFAERLPAELGDALRVEARQYRMLPGLRIDANDLGRVIGTFPARYEMIGRRARGYCETCIDAPALRIEQSRLALSRGLLKDPHASSVVCEQK